MTIVRLRRINYLFEMFIKISKCRNVGKETNLSISHEHTFNPNFLLQCGHVLKSSSGLFDDFLRVNGVDIDRGTGSKSFVLTLEKSKTFRGSLLATFSHIFKCLSKAFWLNDLPQVPQGVNVSIFPASSEGHMTLSGDRFERMGGDWYPGLISIFSLFDDKGSSICSHLILKVSRRN